MVSKIHRHGNDCHERKSFYIHCPLEIEGTTCHTGLHGEVCRNSQQSQREVPRRMMCFISRGWGKVCLGGSEAAGTGGGRAAGRSLGRSRLREEVRAALTLTGFPRPRSQMAAGGPEMNVEAGSSWAVNDPSPQPRRSGHPEEAQQGPHLPASPGRPEIWMLMWIFF